MDYAAQYNAARAEIGKWLEDGSLKRQFHIVEGLDKCPETLPLLFTGGNKGKLYVIFVYGFCSLVTDHLSLRPQSR